MIATASERNHDFLRELGAEPLDYASEDVPGARARALAGEGADAALDLFGGDGRASRRSRPCAAAAAWSRSPSRRRSSARATTRSTTSSCARAATTSASTSRRWCTRGSLRPHVEEVFPLERAADAHERIEDGHVRGKLVLTVD